MDKQSADDEIAALRGGMTKREYFAAMAMQNLQNVLIRKSGAEITQAIRDAFGEPQLPMIKLIARCAVEQADALIEELTRVVDGN